MVEIVTDRQSRSKIGPLVRPSQAPLCRQPSLVNVQARRHTGCSTLPFVASARDLATMGRRWLPWPSSGTLC